MNELKTPNKLERQLAAMIQRRAADITIAPQVAFTESEVRHDPQSPPAQSRGGGGCRRDLVGVGGTIVGINNAKNHRAVSPATSAPGRHPDTYTQGDQLHEADAGQLAEGDRRWPVRFDQPSNVPVSSGKGKTVWQEDNSHNMPLTDPESATTDRWVVFGLTRTQNLEAIHEVLDRAVVRPAWPSAAGRQGLAEWPDPVQHCRGNHHPAVVRRRSRSPPFVTSESGDPNVIEDPPSNQLLDTRNGVIVMLPNKSYLPMSAGPDAIFGDPRMSSTKIVPATVSQVPLDKLSPVSS
jgi:hypothetical protein